MPRISPMAIRFIHTYCSAVALLPTQIPASVCSSQKHMMKSQCLSSVHPQKQRWEHRDLRGAARAEPMVWALAVPISPEQCQEQAWRQELRQQYCLSQGSAESSGLCCFSPVPPQHQESTAVLVPPLEHTADRRTALYTGTGVKVSQAGLCSGTAASPTAGSLTQDQTTTAGMIRACQRRDRAG